MPALQQQPLLGAISSSSLYGPWPCDWVNTNGIFSVAAAGGSAPDPMFNAAFANGGTLPTGGYPLANYDPPTILTGDVNHSFWHEQIQIDNGNLEPSNGPLDKFVTYSTNPGLVQSEYNATNMPEGIIAQHYTMDDDFFHSAFGGSFLNHQWLICACTPVWSQALPAATTVESTFNSTTKYLRDGNITLMPTPQSSPGPAGGPYYVVNTTQTANLPHTSVAADQYLAPIVSTSTNKTIGDEMSTANITWKWYSGGWNDAITNFASAGTCNDPPAAGAQTSPGAIGECFQTHHQPFNYWANFGSSNPANCAAPTPHLCDESVGNGNFLSDLANGTLPAVSFVKPVGVNNEHPDYSALAVGQAHVQSLMAAICASKYWNNTVVIITYDEHGGHWDHVVPPKIDQWGPGLRVPTIIASAYARPHFVDHTQYETVSILSFIETLFGLKPLGTRDAAASPLLNSFNMTQTPLTCQSS
jgi:phospholipase C